MNSPNQFKPRPGPGVLVGVTPASARWKYLSFEVVDLPAAHTHAATTANQEVAIVPLSGQMNVLVAGQAIRLERESVFSQLPHVLYLPPGTEFTVEAVSPSSFTVGGAPAEGRYPLRLFAPDEMKAEVRGGANATRQVNHILGPDLPAERLVLYEVYTPSGFWSGWPPHRHDGLKGSLYIEETYYYRISPPEAGWAIHRNYSPEHDLDELLLVKNGDLVITPVGYHPVSAPPGSNVYFLNYMAGEALNEQRKTPPVDDADWAWMRQDWGGKPLKIPFGKETG